MAAPLTWRNVDAPDFRGSAAGFRESNELLNTALSNISRGIGDFRDANTAISDRDATARAVAMQDPALLKAALQNGQIFSGDESAKTMSAIGSRVSDLIGQQSREQGLQQQTYENNRGQQQDAAVDAFRPFSAQISQGNGTDAAFQQALSTPEGQAAFAKLTPQQQAAARQQNMGIRTGNQGILSGDLGNQSRAQSNMMQGWNDNNTVQSFADNKLSEGLAMDITSKSPDNNAALALYENMRKSGQYTPAVLQSTLGKLQGRFGDLYADPSKGGPTGSLFPTDPATLDPNAGTPNGNVWSRTVGNVPTGGVDLSTQPIGKVLDFGKQVLIPGNRGNAQLGLPADKGSSAIGPFQIVGSTLEQYGPKVLGDDWKSQPFSPANQEKVAKAIFEDNKGGDLTKQWTSLKNAQPGAYKDRSWSDVRSEIMQGEVGQVAADPAAQLAAAVKPAAATPTPNDLAAAGRIKPAAPIDSRQATAELNNRSTQESVKNGVAYAQAKSWGKDSVLPVDVATELSQGNLKGANVQDITDNILDIQKKAQEAGVPMNATYAGEILRNSLRGLTGASWAAEKVLPQSWFGVGNKMETNKDAIDAAIKVAASGGDFDLVAGNNDRSDLTGQIAAAETAVSAAEAQYNKVYQQAQTRTDLQPYLPALLQAVSSARQQRDLLNKAQRSGSNFQSIRGQQPEPAPVARTQGTPVNGPTVDRVPRSLDPSGFSLGSR